ncbi:oxidoreductase [Longibacter salinarum]|uniref:Oxidoreductase n=1 Tax=Longibacter salinarum TaxID=1850348 RepID=A0A2A8CTM7_9BACT|nr:SDR family oxidoreductase [Longibacter salinarum]PEN11205.1 oxidoreductase [Longibacter salinarum]
MVVVVTGASQGIGKAIAERFAEEGTRIALWSRTESKLEAVAETCRSQGAEAMVCPCDVTDDEAVEEAARTVMDEWGAPDVLVNNAGAFTPAPIDDTTSDAFRAQVDVNLNAPYVVTKQFLAPMRKAGQGHLFFMGSIASITAYPGSVAYCAAKHGLLGLARVVREETKDDGLRVTTVMPGATRTPSWDGTELPDDRFMAPEDVADAVYDAYHLSPRTVVEEILLRPQEGDV